MKTYNKKSIADANEYENFIVYQKAHQISGLDWNYFIAPFISQELHEKFLHIDPASIASILPELSHIITFISNGYFTLARMMTANLRASGSLTMEVDSVGEWLIKTLEDADDTEIEEWQKQ